MVVVAMEREDEQQLRGEEEEEDKALRANEANMMVVCAHKER
jgi:hypothetical protein